MARDAGRRPDRRRPRPRPVLGSRRAGAGGTAPATFRPVLGGRLATLTAPRPRRTSYGRGWWVSATLTPAEEMSKSCSPPPAPGRQADDVHGLGVPEAGDRHSAPAGEAMAMAMDWARARARATDDRRGAR